MAYVVNLGGEPANAHEREVVARLKRESPGSYALIPNVSLPDPRSGHAYEYDIIVVAPHAVYAAELKGWRGRIRELNRTTWVLTSGKTVRNPLTLTDNKARILKSLLAQHDLEGPTPYVQACFICGDDATELDLYGADGQRSLRPGDAAAYLADPSRLARQTVVSPAKSRRRKIVEAITGPMRARDAARTYGSYRCTDLQTHDEESATWLAVHAHLEDGRSYRVRTWYLSPYTYDDAARAERLRVLRRTAEALSRIGDHPNVATLRDFGTHEGEFYEVTDWSDAGTLVDAYARGTLGRMEQPTRVRILADIAAGLQATLDAGVVHRALSPESVLLTPDGRARLVDFDRAFVDARGIGTVTGAVDAIHPAWLAPEVRDPDGELFDNTDLYSLGRIGVEMFGDLPEAVTEALHACMSEDPSGRPDDPQAFIDAVTGTADTPTTSAPQEAIRPPPTTFEPGDVIDGTNTVVERLAQGQGSTVYAVINEPLGEVFALKVIDDPPAGYDPLAEFQLLHRLDSDHVLRARWTGRLPDDRTYLLLDHVEGPTLRDALQDGPLELDRALRIADDLLDGLSAVERVGHVHRDVKPDNVVLGPKGAVLVDFSAAAELEHAGRSPVGTLKYTPPDLATTGWTPAADTFAAACTLFELLTGRAPWGDAAPSATTSPYAVATLRPDVPTALASVVQRAISPQASHRYATATTLRTALTAAAAKADEPARAPATTTHLGQVVSDAGGDLWGASLLQRITRHADLLVPLAAALDGCVVPPGDPGEDGLQAALLASEARAHALEAPLPTALPCLYDQLAEGRAPASLTAPDDGEATAARQHLSASDITLVLPGLHFTELAFVAGRIVDRGRPYARFATSAGPIRPKDPHAIATALTRIFDNPIATLEVDGSAAASVLQAGTRGLSVSLPSGDRGRTALGALLATRRAQIDAALSSVLDAPHRLWIVVPWSTIYLGSGLRVDVGANLDARGDSVRARWAAAFPNGRIAPEGTPLPAHVRHPTRSASGYRMPVGRLAWPDPAGTPWLQSGGASLPERLLPLLRVDPRG